MREIKFRGKRVDSGEWVEGGYIRYEHMGRVRHIIVTDWAQVYVNSSDVDPSTVGQFTGLTDKNGTEIYDSDMLTDMVGDVFEVFYNTAHCAYMAKYVRTKYAEKKRGYFKLGDQCSLTIAVIGNIWESPELLK